MQISRTSWIRILLGAIVFLAVLFFIRHNAGGTTLALDSAAAGHRLADAWCKECHSIEVATAGAANAAPDFAEIANRPSTTALSLKVFLRTSHPSMPNIVIAPAETDDLVNYILSLKRN